MTKRKAHRTLHERAGLKHKSFAYRPIELSGEIKSASSGVQIIDGKDFDKRAAALLKEQRKMTVHTG